MGDVEHLIEHARTVARTDIVAVTCPLLDTRHTEQSRSPVLYHVDGKHLVASFQADTDGGITPFRHGISSYIDSDIGIAGAFGPIHGEPLRIDTHYPFGVRSNGNAQLVPVPVYQIVRLLRCFQQEFHLVFAARCQQAEN